MFAVTSRSEVHDPVRQAGPGCTALPRSVGALDLQFIRRGPVTQAQRVFQSGVLRARFPNVPRGGALEAVVINTAGGLTGGDVLKLSVEVEKGATAVVSTQAHEKVYRSSLGTALIVAHATVADGALLEWLPQPTILFDGSRLTRDTHIDVAPGGSFLGVEAVIFGRTTMDEVMRAGSLCDSWTIERNGRVIHADRFDVAGDVNAMLAKPSVLDGCKAMATIRYIGSDLAQRLEQVRSTLVSLEATGAASIWNDLLLVRIAVKDGYLLQRALVPLLTDLRGRALPAVWSI